MEECFYKNKCTYFIYPFPETNSETKIHVPVVDVESNNL